jgi:hypothetical protein
VEENMKYRTVIELICNASDREEASDIAGDYLKGEIDFGVDMKCHTESLAGHRVLKYAISCAAILFIFAAFAFKITPISVEDGGSSKGSYRVAFQDTHTVMPELKTKHREDFKQEWQERKDDAILEYLKR